jgi:hypothetical protein
MMSAIIVEGRHGDRQSEVRPGQVGHQVRRNSAGAAADEDDARGNLGFEGDNFGQGEANQRHDGELAKHADENAPRHLGDAGEVVEAHLRADAEHDELNDRGDEMFVAAEIHAERIEQLLRESHAGEEEDDDPGRELIAG